MSTFDILVIGSGPGGYVAAIRAAQLGFKTGIVEKDALGGICLNWGCIPTKALIKSASVFDYLNHAEDYGISVTDASFDFNAIINRSRNVAGGMSKGVQFLMKKNKIETINGNAVILPGRKVEVTSATGEKQQISAEHIIIATGGRSKELPGISIDGKNVIGYREALVLEKLPKSMLVMGAGAIGVEFAYFYATLGTEVTIVEFMEQGLVPREDPEVSKELTKSFKKRGIKVLANSAVESVTQVDGLNKVQIKDRKSGEKQTIDVEIVLSATGVRPNVENIGLESAGIELEKGYIKVDEYYRTNKVGYYAIGDVIATQALAHVASAEGITCIEKIKGIDVHPIDYNNIPGCTYCHPEIASVGYTEEAARNAGYDLKIGKFPFSASGKASAAGAKEGFIKVIFDSKYGEFLGAHFIGANVTEMIAEVVVARKLETTGHEIIKSIHPHPTMSEAIMEAAAAAYGEVIHI